MAIQVCLLVSDDLDDHENIAEALSEISQNTVLLNLIDSRKAELLLNQAECYPDYLMLDLSMHDINAESILKLARSSLNKVRSPIIVYGSPENFSQIRNKEDVVFFDKDYDYSELKGLLSKIFSIDPRFFE